MCGIGGLFRLRHVGAGDTRAELERLGRAMRMRGPDGDGLWLAAEGQGGLVHRRLAIIDLTDRAAQPMASDDGRHLLVFNGEIYNHRALRSELGAAGERFHSDSDTEVLLRGLIRDGTAFLSRVRGMYAFGLWDRQVGSLLLGRDPFGVKPLYWSSTDGVVRFASQVRALAAVMSEAGTADEARVGFLLWGSVPEPWTWRRGIWSLPPGHTMRVEAGRLSAPEPFLTVPEILCDAERHPTALDRADALRSLADKVHDSVQAHFVSDVPVGVFLSAGLDSAMLAAGAARLAGAAALPSPPLCLTLGFDHYRGTADDETTAAAQITRALGGLQQRTAWIGAAEFADAQARFFADMDQPTIDGVNHWLVARAARANGLKVALSGLGGDEIFASYPSFRQLPKLVRMLGRWPMSILSGAVGSRLRALATAVLPPSVSPKWAGLFEYGGAWAGAYLLRRALYMPWEIQRLLPDVDVVGALARLETLPALARTVENLGSDRLRVSALEMTHYMRQQLLRDADWTGMAHSVEIRVPFVDVDLVRHAAAILARHPDIGKAEVARAVAPRLPAEVLARPKTGFVVPVREWLAGSAPERLQSRGLRGWARLCAERYAEAVA